MLQIQKNTAQKSNHRLNHLLRSLESGWEIEEPVLLGAMWRTAEEQGGVYHFILRNRVEDRTTLISLPPSPQLLVFLAEKKIAITSLS